MANPIAEEALCNALIDGKMMWTPNGLLILDQGAAGCIGKKLEHLAARPHLEQNTLDAFGNAWEQESRFREEKARIEGGRGKVSKIRAGLYGASIAILSAVLGFAFGGIAK